MLLIEALAGVLCATMAALRAPWVSDLYNLVYHNARPRKGESTTTFLFVFPVFLTVGWAMIEAQARGWGRPRASAMPAGLKFAFVLLWGATFFFGSIHRSWLVYTNAY